MTAAVKQQAFQSRNAPPAVVGSAGIVGVSAEDETLHEAIAASLAGGGTAATVGPSDAAVAVAAAPMAVDDAGDDDAAIAAAIAASLAGHTDRVAPGGAAPSGADGSSGAAAMDEDVVDVEELGGKAAAAGVPLAREPVEVVAWASV